MARRAAREAAMRLLYQRSFSDEQDQDSLNELIEEMSLKEGDISYINDILCGWSAHREEIDAIIRERAKGWRFNRISRVDLSILRLALYEIIYRKDIPHSVSINEGVELAKKYGSEKSSVFVNGILGSYIRSGSELNNGG
jgi:N utilization substance protein B